MCSTTSGSGSSLSEGNWLCTRKRKKKGKGKKGTKPHHCIFITFYSVLVTSKSALRDQNIHYKKFVKTTTTKNNNQ